MMKPKKSHATAILAARFGADADYQQMLAEERAQAAAARAIYTARKAAGLTQQELAERVGTTQSVIARLEDSDYEGHSLALLERIAAAIGAHVEIRFEPGVKAAA